VEALETTVRSIRDDRMTELAAPTPRPRLIWERQPNSPWINTIIWTGASGFIAILALAAVFDPTIRWLHAFQAVMYLAVIWLAAQTAYFATIVALFQPRYLSQFPRMLHPHGL